jgi:hypothetical protein
MVLVIPMRNAVDTVTTALSPEAVASVITVPAGTGAGSGVACTWALAWAGCPEVSTSSSASLT